MPKVITSTARDEYLRQFNRFYQIGWLDAERGDAMQVNMVLTTLSRNRNR